MDIISGISLYSSCTSRQNHHVTSSNLYLIHTTNHVGTNAISTPATQNNMYTKPFRNNQPVITSWHAHLQLTNCSSLESQNRYTEHWGKSLEQPSERLILFNILMTRSKQFFLYKKCYPQWLWSTSVILNMISELINSRASVHLQTNWIHSDG